MSWVSTGIYYDRINRIVQKRAAPMASAPLLIESLDFCQLYALREDKEWENAAEILIESAKRLEGAGAEALIINANSMHKLYDDVAAAVGIPILHIAECVGRALKASGHANAALLGTQTLDLTGTVSGADGVGSASQIEPASFDDATSSRITFGASRPARSQAAVQSATSPGSFVM